MLILKPVVQGRSMLSPCGCTPFTFISRMSFSTRTLAYGVDSLVRVSRRDSKNRFGKITIVPQANHTLTGLAFFDVFDFILPESPQLVEDHQLYNNFHQFLPHPSQRFQIFSLSFQSPFHLSFTVLVHYRSPINI